MMSSDLFHFIWKKCLPTVLLVTLSLVLGVNIALVSFFIEDADRIFIIDCLILVVPGLAFYFCHLVEFSMHADNVGDNRTKVFRICGGFM